MRPGDGCTGEGERGTERRGGGDDDAGRVEASEGGGELDVVEGVQRARMRSPGVWMQGKRRSEQESVAEIID